MTTPKQTNNISPSDRTTWTPFSSLRRLPFDHFWVWCFLPGDSFLPSLHGSCLSKLKSLILHFLLFNGFLFSSSFFLFFFLDHFVQLMEYSPIKRATCSAGSACMITCHTHRTQFVFKLLSKRELYRKEWGRENPYFLSISS